MANIAGSVVGALVVAGAGAPVIYSALGIAAASGPAGWVVAGVGMAIYGIFSLFGCFKCNRNGINVLRF